MFLRANKRFKDGKMHRYWSVVENRRVAGGGSVQKTLLYLGEINDSDRASWTRAIEALDEREQTRQIHLFPEDRTPDPPLEHPTLRLRLSQIELARPRQWGGCWLALELWNRLDLDTFWQPLLPDSQKGTPWLKVLKTLVVYRLMEPGSEWRLHRSWFDRSAMADLLDDDFRIALIITPDGLPTGYEVMRGNTFDKTTLADMLRKITDRYGKEQRTWIMDRGIPTEETLGGMRQADPSVRYLFGTPKGRLTRLEKRPRRQRLAAGQRRRTRQTPAPPRRALRPCPQPVAPFQGERHAAQKA